MTDIKTMAAAVIKKIRGDVERDSLELVERLKKQIEDLPKQAEGELKRRLDTFVKQADIPLPTDILTFVHQGGVAWTDSVDMTGSVGTYRLVNLFQGNFGGKWAQSQRPEYTLPSLEGGKRYRVIVLVTEEAKA